jgi:peptide/nickel transport system substrate-binding protein
MVWIKRLAFFLLIFYISCTSEIQNNGNVFVIATYDDIADWDPATAYSLEVLPMSNMYEPLLWLDASDNDHKIIPGLATAYTKSKDGLVWKFALRKNVYFHDGQYFNADAVKYVINRNKSFYRGASYIWSNVKEVRVDGEHDVTFILDKPVPLDRIVSSQYGAWMYSPATKNMSPDSIGSGFVAGTGPYMFNSWQRNHQIELVRNNTYWGGWDKPHYFETIQIRVVSESSTRLQMVESGMADYAVLIPNQLLDRLKNLDDVNVSFFPAWINHFYLLNTKKHPTDNVFVRRAIAAAFDRKKINQYIYGDLGREPTGLIPSNIPLFIAPDSLITFDLQKARNYIKQSGLSNKEINIDFSYVSTSEEYRLTALTMFDNLRKIGVKAKLKPGLWSTNWEKAKNINTAPNIISMAWWPTYSSPSDWFFGLYETQNNPLFNLSYYSNPEVDSLMTLAWEHEATHPQTAKIFYKTIQEKLIDDCVVIPASDLNVQSVSRADIHGLTPNPAYSTLLVYKLERKSD